MIRHDRNVGNLTKNIEDYQSQFHLAASAPVGQERMRAAIPMRKAANESEKLLDALIGQIDSRIQTVKAGTLEHATQMQVVVVAVGLVVVVLGIFFAVLLALSIVRLFTTAEQDDQSGKRGIRRGRSFFNARR